MAKKLLETSIPPGMVDGTPRTVKQRWLRGNFVRFRDGRLRPMGGWQELPLSRHSQSLDSAVRGSHAWRNNLQAGQMAFGTVGASGSYGQLYACAVNTPSTFEDTTADTTDGSSQMTVDDGTAFEVGDKITGSGIPDNTTISAVSGNTITLSNNATATATNITVTITPVAARQNFANITPSGYQATGDTIFRPAFGSHYYGQGYFYSSSFSGAGSSQYSRSSHWVLDNFGATLIGVNSGDGGIFQWGLDPTVRAVEITTPTYSETAPTAVAVCVTQERHVLAVGADNDARLIRWSHRETVDEWAPTATNTAGDLTLQTTGYAVTAKRVRGGTLIFTEVDCHLLSFLGSPLQYGVQRLAENCGVMSPHAVHSSSEITIWLNKSGFWQYDGYVRPVQNCPIQDRVIRTIDWSQEGLIVCGSNAEYGEVIFWCPAKSGTVGECTYYVVYNYRSGVWYDGSATSGISRNSWMDASVFNAPLAADPTDNKLYMHESTDPSQSTTAFAETGAIDINQGTRYTRVSKIYTDTDQQAAGNVNYSFFTSAAADDTEIKSSVFPLEDDGVIDVRLQGRQVRVKVEGSITNDWTIGSPRFELHQGGTR